MVPMCWGEVAGYGTHPPNRAIECVHLATQLPDGLSSRFLVWEIWTHNTSTVMFMCIITYMFPSM